MNYLVIDLLILLSNFARHIGAGPSQIGYGQSALITKAGDKAIIPGWQLRSSQDVTETQEVISKAEFNASEWLKISPRTTIFAGLLENGVYDDAKLFFSNDLETSIDYSAFQVPWYYRHGFQLQAQTGQRYFLKTHGVTSRARIYLNGVMIADENTQVGSYGGLRYNVTEHALDGDNCLLITAFPTNYLRDFAIGFIDWNPYPPDNGTGVWRDVEIDQVGQASLSTIRVTTNFDPKDPASAMVEVITDVTNHGNDQVNAVLTILIDSQKDNALSPLTQGIPITLQPGEQMTVNASLILENPKIWWPAAWGPQPLYKASAYLTIANLTSDSAEPRTFGIRHIESHVNEHNDTSFTINNQPFFVLGAGYTPDLFSRFSLTQAEHHFRLALDMGLNTLRLEGKQSHPDLYALADGMGLMLLPGWECCDKWEGWSYNDDAAGVKWTESDYAIADTSMRHEAAMMQTHPSVLGFLVGSDYWPDDRAAAIYVEALRDYAWQTPIIASAAKRGYPDILGPSGMKMDGPYDWVPPNYWASDRLGGAFGFGSELGAGVGTPDIASLSKFLSPADLDDLWRAPEKGLYHMSTNVSQFYTRGIYNEALAAKYGAQESLDDYLWKAQVMDYEATRAQFEAYSMRKQADRPSTGLVYWMLNNAWPSLHWQLFDYYGKPATSYYGVKTALRAENAVLDYGDGSVWAYSHRLDAKGKRRVVVDVIGLDGRALGHEEVVIEAVANGAKKVLESVGLSAGDGVSLLRIVIKDEHETVLSRSVYWLAQEQDVLDWESSTWYYTPVTKYADLSSLFDMETASLGIKTEKTESDGASWKALVTLENTANVPAFFIKMELNNVDGQDVSTAIWSDNFVTLLPGESVELTVEWRDVEEVDVVTSGVNIKGVHIGM